MLSWPWGLRPCPLDVQAGPVLSAHLDSALSGRGLPAVGHRGELKRKTESEELHLMPSRFGVATGVLYPLTRQDAGLVMGWKESLAESWET